MTEQINLDELWNKIWNTISGLTDASESESKQWLSAAIIRVWAGNKLYSDTYLKAINQFSSSKYTADQLKSAILMAADPGKKLSIPKFFTDIVHKDAMHGTNISRSLSETLGSILVQFATINGDFTIEEANNVQEIMDTLLKYCNGMNIKSYDFQLWDASRITDLDANSYIGSDDDENNANDNTSDAVSSKLPGKTKPTLELTNNDPLKGKKLPKRPSPKNIIPDIFSAIKGSNISGLDNSKSSNDTKIINLFDDLFGAADALNKTNETINKALNTPIITADPIIPSGVFVDKNSKGLTTGSNNPAGRFGSANSNDGNNAAAGNATTTSTGEVKAETVAAPEEPEETLEDVMEELNSLVGLDQVKKDVESLMNFIKVCKIREERGMNVPKVSYHLVFTGNPGTGKTTVARLVAKLYKHMGILPQGQLIETDRSGLVAGFLGQTAIKTQEVIQQAMGGVLFVDEAYALANDDQDSYGKEAIETILKAMEDHRDELVVIVAGYDDLMHKFIESNPGLRSRFNKYFHFPDYDSEALIKIMERYCSKNGYKLDEKAAPFLKEKLEEAYENRDKHFGNARFVRNVFESAIHCQANRLAKLDFTAVSDTSDSELAKETISENTVEKPCSIASITDDDLITITKEDLEQALAEQ